MSKQKIKYIPYFPIIGLAIYLVLFVLAAFQYPGGSYNEPTNISGYSFFHNFLCDTMNPITESGQINTARPLAISAHLTLSFIMISFFFILPKIFSEQNKNTKYIGLFGMLSMVLFIFMFTEYHDLFVITTAVFGSLAFIALIRELKTYDNKNFKILTYFVFAISVIVFITYQTKIGFYYTPILQKTAFFIDATIVVWTALLVIKKNKVEVIN